MIISQRLAAILATVILCLGVQATATEPHSLVASMYGRPRQLISVEGKRRLNLICMGHGKPVVIFLFGLGSGSFDWRKVQPAIGRETRACAYDRAGYGFSDPANHPADAANAVSDLHALILAAKFPTPVVFVGHSLGGLYATLYAQTYPKMVAGMLLVDPAFPGQAQAIADAVGPAAAHQLAVSQLQTLASIQRCITLAKLGRLSSPAQAKSDCLDNPPDPDPDVHRERNREAESAAYELAVGSEFQNANVIAANGRTTDDNESPHHGASLGAIPLVVLTRGNVNERPGLTANQISRAEAAWRAGHDRLAALSRDGTNVVVPHAGHFIQLDEPNAVITQIKRILTKIRS